MLLSIPQYPRQPHPKEQSSPDVHSVEVERACWNDQQTFDACAQLHVDACSAVERD